MPMELFEGRWLDDGRNLRLVVGNRVIWVNVWPLDTADVAAPDGTTLLQLIVAHDRGNAGVGLTYDRLSGEVVEIRDAAGALTVDETVLRNELREVREAIVARCAMWPRDEHTMRRDVELRAPGCPMSYETMFPAAYGLAASERDDPSIDGIWWAIDGHCTGIECQCRRCVLEIVHAGAIYGLAVYEMSADAPALAPDCPWEPWMTAETAFGLTLRERSPNVPTAVARAFGRGFLGRMVASRFFGVQSAVRSRV